MTNRYLSKILIALLCIGFIARFINLSWGAPYFFHPDERNIASAISGLQFPAQLNPHFFAYGSLPIYLAFFLGIFKNLLQIHPITDGKVSFEDAIIILRFISAILSTASIFLVYKIGEQIKDRQAGIIGAILSTTGVGMIQYAHFGTFEMWLTFFSTLLFYGALLSLSKPTTKSLLILSVSLAVLVSVKISSVIYIPLVFLVFLKRGYSFPKKITSVFLILFITTTIYILTNPFSILDYHSFANSISYESNVVLGKLHVFYTGEFLTANPVLFPFIRIYPFLLNPIILLIFLSSIGIVLTSLRKKFSFEIVYLFVFFLLTFLSQTLLFAQWTRYFIPTLPFIYLIAALGIDICIKRFSKNSRAALLLILTFTCSLFSVAFIKTTYLNEDTRVEAMRFAKNNLGPNSAILSEVYDLGITPFNPFFPNITLFNFYDIDNNSPESTPAIYKNLLARSDYLILPSQRLYKTRLLDPSHFPLGSTIYSEIKNSSVFERIYETPCDIWCKITYLNSPIFRFEQTVNIFDRPSVMIFKINHEK